MRYKMFEKIGTTHLLIDDFSKATISEYTQKMAEGKLIHLGMQLNGEWIAQAGGILKADFPSYYFKDNIIGYIMDVYVHPDHRNKGYAKELIIALEVWFKENDVTTVKLDTSRFGRPVYEKLGYENSIEMSKKLG